MLELQIKISFWFFLVYVIEDYILFSNKKACQWRFTITSTSMDNDHQKFWLFQARFT